MENLTTTNHRIFVSNRAKPDLVDRWKFRQKRSAGKIFTTLNGQRAHLRAGGRGLGPPLHHLLAPLDSNPNVVIIHLGKKKTSLLLTEQDLLRPFWGDLPMQFYERVKKAALEFGISQKELISRAVDDLIQAQRTERRRAVLPTTAEQEELVKDFQRRAGGVLMEKCNCRGTPEDDTKNLESTMENEQEAKGTKLKEKLENLVGFSPTLGLPDDVNRKRGELCTGPSAANRVPCAVNGVLVISAIIGMPALIPQILFALSEFTPKERAVTEP